MVPPGPAPASLEHELVELFRASGDNAHFDALYRSARRKVFGVCLKFLRDRDASEDVTHESFLRAYEKFASMEGTNFSAWVCRIATNLCLNRIRDRQTRQRLLDESVPPGEVQESVSVERAAIRAEQGRLAREVLGSLNQRQRIVLLLKYVEGCSYQEIEAITGYDAGQVRSYLQNARRNFQIRWEHRRASVESAR